MRNRGQDGWWLRRGVLAAIVLASISAGAAAHGTPAASAAQPESVSALASSAQPPPVSALASSAQPPPVSALASAAQPQPVSAAQPPLASATFGLELPGDATVAILVSVEQALLDLTNADRVANGLPPLDVDPDTLSLARQRAASQLHTPALSHYDAAGNLAFVDLLTAAHLGYQLAGENLARSSVDDAGVTQRTEQALMLSPLHRKNILEPSFRRVAIGSASDGQGQITFAELYRD